MSYSVSHPIQILTHQPINIYIIGDVSESVWSGTQNETQKWDRGSLLAYYATVKSQ
ncbi:hypothetical protein KSS87_007893, partial [Heliosperma pusillum]